MATDKKEMVEGWEKLGVSPTGIGMVPQLLDLAWDTHPKFTICLVGETGIGKTPIVHQWAKARNGYMRVLNFGHMSQEDISMIMFNEDGSEYDFKPPTYLVELNREAEERGCAVLFLDEWNRGDKSNVNALFTLTDERRIHNFHLHRNVLVVAAMNPSDGSYLVNEAEKDHAIRKRLCMVYVRHDLNAWLEHTRKSAWHPLVPDFISAANTFLYDTGTRDAGKAFPCPSNWEKVSRILLSAEKLNVGLTSLPVRTLVEGQIGNVATTKFMDFVADRATLIEPSEVLYRYKTHSDVRKRVASLRNCVIDKDGKLQERSTGGMNKSDPLVQLCENVATALFTSPSPDITKVAPHLALFIGDLPNEILSVFATEQLTRASNFAEQTGNGGKQYLANLSNAMSVYQPYKDRLKDINTAMREYRQIAGIR